MPACWSCGHPTDVDDRYCRRCGRGQGSRLPWYYRPVWILVLTVTALGPFALPLVWRTPRLGRPAKWIASAAIVALTWWIGWQFMRAAREIHSLLAEP